MTFVEQIRAYIVVTLLFCINAFSQAAKQDAPVRASADFQYTTLQVPGSTSTFASGVNSQGDIVGSYSTGGNSLGFLYTGGTFQTIFCPNARYYTQAKGINDAGVIVGVCDDVGFIYQNGAYSYVRYPVNRTRLTQLTGINNQGVIVGGALLGRDNLERAFVYSNGTFSIVSSNRTAQAINNVNTVAGYNCNPNKPGCSGALYPQTPDGWRRYKKVMYPGSVYTLLYGINDNGDLAGVWGPDQSGHQQNFVYFSSTKTFSPLVVGNSVSSDVHGISNSGEVVGSYFDGTTVYGFYGYLSH